MDDAPTSPAYRSERGRALRAVALGLLLGAILALIGRRRADATRG